MKEKIELNSGAVRLRKKFGEDDSSPIDIFALINSLDKMTLVFHPMSAHMSGMSVRIGEDALIAVNSTRTYGRQRFTAAHELYHLYVQKTLKTQICGIEIGNEKDVEEKNADAFASYFLAPYDALNIFVTERLGKTQNDRLTIIDIVKIEQYFQMSRQATLNRLVDENYLPKTAIDQFKINVKQSAMILGYDDALYSPTPEEKQYRTMGSYIELVEKVKQKGIISQGKFEELLLEAYRSDIVYNLNVEGESKYD